MTRIAVVGGTVVSVALLLSGCSGGSSAAKDKAPTTSEATTAAKAINLSKADVPSDFKSTPADDSDNEGGAIPEDVADCLGLKGSAARGADDIVDLSSDDFAKGDPPNGVQVSSEVEVVPSTKDAKRVLAIFKSDKASSCLAKSFESELKKEIGTGTPGVTVGKVKVTTLSPAAAGTDGSFGFTLVIPVQGPGITINVTTEIRGFLKKHTEVTLLSLTYGSGSGLDSEALFAKLVSRAGKSAV